MYFVQGLKGRIALLLAGLCLCAILAIPAYAAPPVRVAVVPGGGSGMEQDVVDQISQQLGGMDGLELSTTNPDWYVVCNIKENIDQMSGQIRYNGNILIKTVSGKSHRYCRRSKIQSRFFDVARCASEQNARG